MSIHALKEMVPDFAKDIKLNLGTVLTPEGAPDLSEKQIYLIALASAWATKQADLITALSDMLAATEIEATKSAAAIMAMNNIYYRFTHALNNETFATLPAKLRMNVMANSGIDKIDFELCCLAVSALNGCGLCMESHTKALLKHGITQLGIQSAVRIAAVINATALSLIIS